MGASLLALAKSIYYFVYELVFICFPHFSPFCFSSSFRGVLFQRGRTLSRVSGILIIRCQLVYCRGLGWDFSVTTNLNGETG